MSTSENPIAVLHNTRQVSVRLAPGITAERLATAFNERRVKIDGNKLVDGYDNTELGERLVAVNVSDYRVTDAAPGGEFDTLDPYGFKYNEI